MDGHIDLNDHRVRTLERLRALTGRPVASILDDALSAACAGVTGMMKETQTMLSSGEQI